MLYETRSKWMLPALLLSAWILAACAVAPVQLPQSPSTAITPSAASDETTITSATASDETDATQTQATVDALRSQLVTQLQVDAAAVEVVAVEGVAWPDACLGAPGPEEVCAQVVTPGYRITLRADGQEYTYHTDSGPYWLRLVAGPEPSVGAPVVTWTGTVDNGSCQEAIIGVDGVAFGFCGGPKLGGKFVSPARQRTLATFAARYASFAAETDLGQINFTGSGMQEATPEEQLQLASWAQLVVMEAAAGVPMGSLAWYGPAASGSPDTSKCASLTLGSGEATVTGCDGAIETTKLNGGPLTQWLEIQDSFAPFVLEMPTERLAFAGMGAVTGEVWQRALLTWARTQYAERSSGKVSAAGNTVLSWDLGPTTDVETSCMHLTVLAWGYAYAETRPCAGGDVQMLTAGWLETAELAQLEGWLSGFAPLNVDDGYVSGTGTQSMGPAELAAVEEWAARVWLRLHGAASPQAVDAATGRPAACLTPTGGAQLLVDTDAGYCLLYPAGYLAEQTAPGTVNLVLGSLMNHIDPRVTIEVADAAGRMLAVVGDQLVAAYGGFDFTRGTTTIDGVEALVLNNLPGQDLNRRVAVIHDGRLYTFFFTPLGEAGDVRAKLETFYQGVVDSFRFLEEKAK